MNVKALKFIFFFVILMQGGMSMATFFDDVIVSGISAKYITIASAMFEQRLDVNWENYSVKITDDVDNVIVIFSSKDIADGLRGSAEGVPGFEVRINKEDFTIVDSQFVR
jgi:hypothetical protein